MKREIFKMCYGGYSYKMFLVCFNVYNGIMMIYFEIKKKKIF